MYEGRALLGVGRAQGISSPSVFDRGGRGALKTLGSPGLIGGDTVAVSQPISTTLQSAIAGVPEDTSKAQPAHDRLRALVDIPSSLVALESVSQSCRQIADLAGVLERVDEVVSV